MSTSSSHYLTDLSQTIEIKDDSTLSKDSLDENQIGINDMQNEGGITAKADVLCEDCEEDSAGNDIISKKTIADIRYNFDVNSADQVKEVQATINQWLDGLCFSGRKPVGLVPETSFSSAGRFLECESGC